MKMLKNQFWSLTLNLNILRIFGFLVPGNHSPLVKKLLWAYWLFWVMFINEIYIIIQCADLFIIWGDLPLMVSSSFLLFTNLAFAVKIAVFRFRRAAVLTIIDEGEQELRDEDRAEGRAIINEHFKVPSCQEFINIFGLIRSNRETAQQLQFCLLIGVITTGGWIASAEPNSLPLRAWYPYDEYQSPAYEITYTHQCLALVLIAAVNINMDSFITSLMAVCRCRFRLLNLSLRTLCTDLNIKEKNLLRPDQEETVSIKLRDCIVRHQAVLRSADEIQACFTEPILAQFTVSMIIICVSAYELTVDLHADSKNIIKIIAMITYLIGMILQVFLFCYQGDQLANESTEICYAAYQCEWYKCSLRLRRDLLVVMVRTRRVAKITAGGFTTLSLACFSSIIKASYTFFTVLQQVEDR